MGETRVDFHQLLEDLRDAYPGALEETILTEVVVNSLDSGATCLSLKADPASSTLTIVDDGSGMRRDLVRYHDLAASTKTRGHAVVPGGKGRSRPGRYGLTIRFESQEADPDLGRLVESTVVINDTHPAYRRAVASRSERCRWLWRD